MGLEYKDELVLGIFEKNKGSNDIEKVNDLYEFEEEYMTNVESGCHKVVLSSGYTDSNDNIIYDGNIVNFTIPGNITTKTCEGLVLFHRSNFIVIPDDVVYNNDFYNFAKTQISYGYPYIAISQLMSACGDIYVKGVYLEKPKYMDLINKFKEESNRTFDIYRQKNNKLYDN